MRALVQIGRYPSSVQFCSNVSWTANEEGAFAFAQELLAFSLELAKAPELPPITAGSRRDPKIVGLTLLCRSITNFRAVLLLVRVNPPNVVESRALARLIFENFFFLAALCEHGADFVRAMRSDEAANRKALGEFALKKLSDEEKDLGQGLTLRTRIKELLSEFPKPVKFSVKGVAAQTVADTAYLSYATLSMDAHPSVTSLRRHIQWEAVGDIRQLTLTVVPGFAPEERMKTIHEACVAFVGVCIAVNQLLGGTAKSDDLRKLFERFEAGAA
jgi:hypothetical protein